ncbi:hypothetical protein AZI86_01085 [Bdellovibrio bacteriovorus]|uniref:Uncharacterized protein n=1 Tax=Bdellovibrio bacteriovorus TaxID=959 RepID=A0A150WMR2_BDEBC|nr:polyprenyl synthetase family protein [Bdellovibrio bacteriovorus]KYG65700.1 hypothetical protein AZI86_01085 [Bdellovibrio bacteriovorus]
MLNEAPSADSWNQISFESYASVVSELMDATIEANTLGSFRKIVQSHFTAPGKMIRPYLAYRLGHILQTPYNHSTAWATTCELLHNATLIHDDVQDRDVQRRGKPTLWTQFGDAQAINAGDFLMMSSFQPVLLSSASAEIKNKLMMLFSRMTCKIVGGQSLELELNTLKFPEVIYQHYLHCIGLKTAALFSDLAVGLNMLSPHSPYAHEDIDQLFSKIGILFQMQDDIIDLYGDKQRDGRGCDIKEGKTSFLVATHIQKNPEDFGILKSILEKPRALTTDEDIFWVEELFANKGTLRTCQIRVSELKKEILSFDIVRHSSGMQNLIAEMLNMIFSGKVAVNPDAGR